MPQAKSDRRAGLVALDASRARTAGKVWLVGAGPGDPDLMTVKAVNALAHADVVVHDGLVSEEILALIPARSRRIAVAKRKSRHSYPQADIEKLIVALALDGLEVVRLKGGDPFVFGRGGEELEACCAAGLEVEVVPGITAALAAAAGAGAPLTHRGAAQALTLVTAHGGDGDTADLDWRALARANHTVAVYMGLSKAGEVAARLIAAGRSPATPALIVENASLASERRLVTSLQDLGETAKGLGGPALLLIGEAMELATVSSQAPVAQPEPRRAVR